MSIRAINTVVYRRLFFSCQDFFLTDNYNLEKDINYFIQSPININNSLNEFNTLLISLDDSEEIIWKNIYHRTRTEINSFVNNQVFEHKLLFNISRQELAIFINLFNEFAKFKKIRTAEKDRLKAYNKIGALAISFMRQNGKYLCVNFYRVNNQRATNLYSFHFKHKQPSAFNASHFGRAHRTLHWLDILEFKKMKIEKYDFCGWYNGQENKDLLNINKFKEQFTKCKVKEYSGVIYKNKLLSFLIKLKR